MGNTVDCRGDALRGIGAVVAGRGFATPDDVKAMALPVLRHRVLLLPEVEVEGRTPDQCINELLLATEVPR